MGTADDKKLAIGLAMFGTFCAGGLSIVFAHVVLGTLLILLGLAGLGYSIWERHMVGATPYRAWLLVLGIALTWALIGYDVYDRHALRSRLIPAHYLTGWGVNPDDLLRLGARETRVRVDGRLLRQITTVGPV